MVQVPDYSHIQRPGTLGEGPACAGSICQVHRTHDSEHQSTSVVEISDFDFEVEFPAQWQVADNDRIIFRIVKRQVFQKFSSSQANLLKNTQRVGRRRERQSSQSGPQSVYRFLPARIRQNSGRQPSGMAISQEACCDWFLMYGNTIHRTYVPMDVPVLGPCLCRVIHRDAGVTSRPS